MRGITTLAFVVAVAAPGTTTAPPSLARSEAVVSPCAPSDTDLVQDLLSLFEWMMAGDDSARTARRTQMALPRVDPATIVVVADTAVCRTAAVAYTRALQDATVDRSVHVFKIGDRYVVLDPVKWAGQITPNVTFDSTFTTELARVLQ